MHGVYRFPAGQDSREKLMERTAETATGTTHYPISATVIPLAYKSTSLALIKDLIDYLNNEDDVFSIPFTRFGYIIIKTKHLDAIIRPEVIDYFKKDGAELLLMNTGLPAGPYFIRGRFLHQAWRLFPDKVCSGSITSKIGSRKNSGPSWTHSIQSCSSPKVELEQTIGMRIALRRKLFQLHTFISNPKTTTRLTGLQQRHILSLLQPAHDHFHARVSTGSSPKSVLQHAFYLQIH